MNLDNYELTILHSLYEDNKIPISIFNEGLELLYSSFPLQNQHIIKPLAIKILPKANVPSPDFQIYSSLELEMYYYFTFKREDILYYIFAGPVLLVRPLTSNTLRYLSFSTNMITKDIEEIANLLPVITLTKFQTNLKLMMLLIGKNSLSLEEIKKKSTNIRLSESSKEELTKELLNMREDERKHSSYKQELILFNCVKEGNSSKLAKLFDTVKLQKIGHLSDNPLKQFLYASICATTLITRFAIEGGLHEEKAYTLSDVYIRRLDSCKTLSEINKIYEQLIYDFTNQVAASNLDFKHNHNPVINKCIDYIIRNIHQKITLDTLSKEVHLTPKYLSALFYQETNEMISNFIQKAKIDEAKNMLMYSDYTFLQIANYLSFSSQSYFISVFKKHVGITPKEFRSKFQ